MLLSRQTAYLIGILCLGFSLIEAEKYKWDVIDRTNGRGGKGNKAGHAGHSKGPRQRQYHGMIREDAPGETVVDMDRQVLVTNRDDMDGDEICGYTVYKSHSDLPFKVVLKERQTGEADIVLIKGYKLNYERRHKYSFEISAHDCVTGAHGPKERVHIEVEDVNEYAPTLQNTTYILQVVEGQIVDEIVRLQAQDQDGSEEFSKICHFHILTPDVPFEISKQGVLRNTEPLDFSKKHNYILEVKAEDCGGVHSRVSDKVMINIDVKPVCKPGWTGVSERIEYLPGSRQIPVAQKASLQLCDSQCQPQDVSAKISLTTKHIGKGCDRDTYSIQSQRKLCGASAGIVDLLPRPQPGKWTQELPTDDGQESDQIFSFDGASNAIEVPAAAFNHSLGGHFTIMTWMKHEQDAAAENGNKHGAKEHILCNSDGEKMNRHHYSFFVHNCRLVFLMRQEPEGKDINTFKPAEWRWKIPQVCDGAWHHYAISVDFPDVRLYIDGKLFVESANNPEIIDDWPLHRTKAVHFTKLIVGACYQGGDRRLAHYFKGYLAGLSMLKGKTEGDRVIKCLNNCKEKLDFHAMNEMDTGMSIAFNSEMTEITINGHNHTEVEHLVHKVGYLNSRTFPTPGHRALRIQTQVTCASGEHVSIPPVDTLIMVLQAEKPIITITATDNIARLDNDFVHGHKIFSDLSIVSRTKKEAEELEDSSESTEEDSSSEEATGVAAYQLDSCLIRADPDLDLDSEHLQYPANRIQQFGLEASEREDGLVIRGADRISNYEQVLREVRYINRKPENLNSRAFIVTCSELNGRFVSNELKVTVDVLHNEYHRASVPQAHAQVNDLHAKLEPVNEIRLDTQAAKTAQFVPNIAHGGTSVGMSVIIVVCVGFLIFMIVLGIIRIRAAHNRTQVVTVEEREEMEWDNSALTITVNPMDTEMTDTGMAGYDAEAGEIHALRGGADDSDSDDDDASSYHDELESSEEESEKVKDRELEWDDSTLTF